MLQSRIGEAMVSLEKTRSAMPDAPVHGALTSAYALICDAERVASDSPKPAGGSATIVFSSIARKKPGSGRSSTATTTLPCSG
jgi:hypothetical protein